ncbi:hypothetical protein [Variovorax soli]|uniref:Uncharacterized protein n=1 Tax=Variovorax soli TaxID=376815 RepID=A0ABU1NBM7_9BURK|nr:hypothetical protein [Variovorax soli]MDR6535857.1 hypothetical protein [Variovorax soli]
MSFAIESVLAELRSAPARAGFDFERAAAGLSTSPELELLSTGFCLRAISGVAPLVPIAGCVGGVVGLGVDVSSLPPVAGWVGGAPGAAVWAVAQKDASARQVATSAVLIVDIVRLLEAKQ